MTIFLLSIFRRNPRNAPTTSKGEGQQILVPCGAQTHRGKILAALERGVRLTALSASVLCCATSADRRIRDVAKRLRSQPNRYWQVLRYRHVFQN